MFLIVLNLELEVDDCLVGSIPGRLWCVCLTVDPLFPSTSMHMLLVALFFPGVMCCAGWFGCGHMGSRGVLLLMFFVDPTYVVVVFSLEFAVSR